MRPSDFHVPSLQQNRNPFGQYMLTILLLVIIFAFGLAMPPHLIR